VWRSVAGAQRRDVMTGDDASFFNGRGDLPNQRRDAADMGGVNLKFRV